METPTKPETKKRNVYQIVTDRIIELLAKGTVPWRKPWAEAGLPQNLITKRQYRGINIMLLASLGYAQNLFVTLKQLKELNAQAKQGEKPHIVVMWQWDEPKKEGEEDAGEKKSPVLKYYQVYNISQCEGIPQNKIPSILREAYPIPACEKIVAEMPNPPKIQHKVNRSFYNPIDDVINLPAQKNFESDESYYTTLFHELIHSTGHIMRLNRKGLLEMSEQGGDAYSFEELVAEIGAAYLESMTGIAEKEIKQNAAYIDGWLARLKGDTRLIVLASSLAQKATDYILAVDRTESAHEDSGTDDLPF